MKKPLFIAWRRGTSVLSYWCAGLLWVSAAVGGFAQDSFARGEELFMQDNPQEAAVHLQNAINEEPGNVKAFLYLGIAYEQLGRPDEAVAVYLNILERAGEFTANVANNLGNVYFKQGDFSDAELMYTQAIEADDTYVPAWLGRANARIKLQSFRGAVSDYDQYLQLEPDSRQKEMIEQLTDYLRPEILAAEEAERLAEQAALDEAERLAAEKAAAREEDERLAAEEAALAEADLTQDERWPTAAVAARVEAEWQAAGVERSPTAEQALAEAALTETERRVLELEEALAEALLADARRRRQAAGETARPVEAVLAAETVETESAETETAETEIDETDSMWGQDK
jgi:tetratricopeptide (TPR) repeat protein